MSKEPDVGPARPHPQVEKEQQLRPDPLLSPPPPPLDHEQVWEPERQP